MIRSVASTDAVALPTHLTDPRGRRLDYLRLAVTDLCNLRCRYCMPEKGVKPVSHADILSHEESLRLAELFCGLGVRKIRVTGGEPLVRRGVVPFMAALAGLTGRPEVLLTTNGLLLERHLDDLVAGGLKRVNLSLDSLDPATWRRITRRSGFDDVRRALDAVLQRGLGLKINVVVLAGLNDHELGDFVALTRELPLTVRFIEAMPFSGSAGEHSQPLTGDEILGRIGQQFELEPATVGGSDVARVFRVPGHVGRVGIIEGHSRSFCGSCNRLRVDARGGLRTCLYGRPVLNLKDMMRGGVVDGDLATAIVGAVQQRHRDGHQAALHATPGTSMASIGG
ncbi:GTP 3',8-cyclase MoaA [bacterium]|nr:MAG: GTP 3',8-cyclase MoaA [bacterium]